MDLRYSEAEEVFRSELRAWLAKTVPTLGPPPSPHDWPARRRYDTTWQRMLYDAGYAGIDWPVEGGGRGASPIEQLVYLEELERAACSVRRRELRRVAARRAHHRPWRAPPEQRQRFLPPILKRR